jgi:hypothetical protein
MINLHQKYNHYLKTDKILDEGGVHEKVITYGWTDDGKELTGYYVLTECHALYYNLKEELIDKENRCPTGTRR